MKQKTWENISRRWLYLDDGMIIILALCIVLFNVLFSLRSILFLFMWLSVYIRECNDHEGQRHGIHIEPESLMAVICLMRALGIKPRSHLSRPSMLFLNCFNVHHSENQETRTFFWKMKTQRA